MKVPDVTLWPVHGVFNGARLPQREKEGSRPVRKKERPAAKAAGLLIVRAERL
jgi:hypothetical protein